MYTINLFGEVDAAMAEKAFHAIWEVPEKEILLSSMGGDLTYGLAIYDLLKTKNVTITATGIVGSAASLIYLAGAKRLATPNTIFLIHEPWYEVETEREQQEAEKWIPFLSKTIDGLYRKIMGADYDTALLLGCFGVEDAIRWGLTHKVEG